MTIFLFVIDAVMDASAVLEKHTEPPNENAKKAIQTFEEVFFLAGDGSEKDVEQIHGDKIAADISALNEFTIPSLLRAHVIRADYKSALRVLHSWPWKGMRNSRSIERNHARGWGRAIRSPCSRTRDATTLPWRLRQSGERCGSKRGCGIF